MSAEGKVSTWFDIARLVFKSAGHDETRVSKTTTEEYFKDKPHAERPRHSTFDLSKVQSTGFQIADWEEKLVEYISMETSK